MFLVGVAVCPTWGLEGVVVLDDGSPVADATVTILGQNGSTRTGPAGLFTWVPEPPLPFSVLVILPGGVYSSPVLIESLPSDGRPVQVPIRLLASETVTVTAGVTPHTEAPPASAATLVGREELSQQRPATLVEAIQSVPGIGKLGEGHAAVPSIRGLARGRTLLLIDGGRVTSERRAGPSASYLDPFFLEAIEVSRGFGSVTYGSDAFGGIIHARTRQASPNDPLGARLRTTLGAGKPEGALGGEVSKGWADGGAILQGRLRRFEDYDSPEGSVAFSGARDGGARGQLNHEWGPGRLHLGWQSDLGRDVGKPALDSHEVESSYPREDSHRLTLGYDPDAAWGFSRLGAQGFLGWYRLVTQRNTLATPESPRTLRESDVRARDYGLRISGTRPLGDWRLDVGLDLNGRADLQALGATASFEPTGDESSRVEETAIEEASRRDLGIHATLDGRVLERLTAAAGLRLDAVRTRNLGGFFGDHATSHAATSGFVSVTGGPVAGGTITGQVGWGFRDPTLSDRYFRGVTGRGFITGLPELEPERSLQYELALRRDGRVRTALHLYRYRISNLVERFRSGSDYLFRNRGAAILRGLEVEVQTEVRWGVTVDLGLQAASGEAADDGTPLADIPPEGLTLTLRKALGTRGSAGLRGAFRAADHDPGPTEVETPRHVVLDASWSWRWGSRLESRLVLRNLLDQSYPGSADESAVLAPGRSAALTLSASF